MAERSPKDIQRGISRLQERIDALRAFDVSSVNGASTPELVALSVAITDTVERCFNTETSAYKRFKFAARLQAFSLGRYRPTYEHQAEISGNIMQSIALLQEAQRVLSEDLADAEHEAQKRAEPSHAVQVEISRRVFVVHGHDDGAREMVARFLEKIGFEAIILHEQANQGRTVIEKVEAHGDVGFAVVLLTPDDEGCVKGGEPEPRARQNVLLELGYFIGRLGRGKVCALKRGTLEIPSDFAGVVWEPMDAGGGWKTALGRELQAVGHEVDWNMVMRP